MSILLHAVFNIVFGNAYFIIVILNVCGLKMRFSGSSQISVSQKSIFGQFEVIFPTYKIFPGRMLFFHVSTSKRKVFDEKISSLAGLKTRSYSISQKITNFGHF